jgi:predicted nucleic-acid-binding protein
MSRAFVDANVILRFLTGDPPDMAAQARALLAVVDAGELTLILDEIVIAEMVWVLESFYGYSHAAIAHVLRELLSHEGLEADNKPGLLAALSLYVGKNVDFADALLAIRMQQSGISEVFSFDRHFDRLPDIKRVSPGEAAD